MNFLCKLKIVVKHALSKWDNCDKQNKTFWNNKDWKKQEELEVEITEALNLHHSKGCRPSHAQYDTEETKISSLFVKWCQKMKHGNIRCMFQQEFV